MMAPLIALIALPILEIYVLVQVGTVIGALPTIGLLLATSFAGAWLVRHAGGRAWAAFTQAVAERRPPHREVVDGALVLLGGALMVVPGFVTDAVGLLCLFPPTRGLARWALLRSARRAPARFGPVRVRSYRQTGTVHPPGRVIDGESEIVSEDREPPKFPL